MNTAQPLTSRERKINLVGALLALIIVLGTAMLMPRGGAAKVPSWALTLHVSTALLALPLGAWVLYARKGDTPHKSLGYTWFVLMMLTAFASAFIQSWGTFSPIHIFSVWTPISLVTGIIHARNGNVEAHRAAMKGTYIGLVVAGVLAVALPGRFLWKLLFG